MTHENAPKCPDCGSEMRWKYLGKPHCQACNHTRGIATQTDPDAGSHSHPSAFKEYRNRATTRYVYHVNGHARLHATNGDDGPVVPFEVVLRRPFAIDSDDAMDEVRQDVRKHIVTELEKLGSPYLAGDVMIRGVSKLHRILVDANDPNGAATRIFS